MTEALTLVEVLAAAVMQGASNSFNAQYFRATIQQWRQQLNW